MDKEKLLSILKKTVCVGSILILQNISVSATPTAGWAPNSTADSAETTGIMVTGSVSDGTEPIVGATVRVKGTTKGAITDIDGKFSLSDVPEKGVLIISYVGFETEEISINGKRNFDIVLKKNSSTLDEVVVVGFGTQKKVNLTGSVASVSGEKFENRPVSNVGQALQGVVPNLNIGISDGAPNTVPSFNVRGGTTISGGAVSNGEPLILIDGVDSTPTQLNQMNPNDIENISIIKDASAAAIYGTRAAFGVILVTTKGGNYNQKGHITYSYEVAWDRPAAMPDIMTSVGLLEAQQLVKEWTLQQVSDSEKARLEAARRYMENPTVENRYFINGGSIDWVMNVNPYKTAVKDWTPTQKHNLSISGGSNSVNYYISLGFHDQDGMYNISYDKYRRYNVMSRVSAKVTSWFNVGAKINFNRTTYSTPTMGGAKGSLWTAAQREPEKNIMMPMKTLPTDEVPDAWTDNILSWMAYGRRSNTSAQTTVFALNPEFIILPGKLKARADLNYQIQNTNNTTKDPYHLYIKPGSWTLLNEANGANDGNTGSISKSTTNSYLINVYLDYNQTFGKNNIAAILGYSQDYVDYSSLTTNLKRLFSADVLNPSAAEDITLHTTTTGAQRRTSRAGFGRITYNFDDRYLFEINGRYDGSSRFTPKERFVFLPSFSAAWRISEEKFFTPLSQYINNLKIRGSWGKLGSQPSDYYPYQAVMGSGQPGFIIDGTYVSAVNAPGLVSPTLTWEKATTGNLGIDITALSSRLNVSFDIYQRKTTDILTTGTVAYPSLLGASAPLENSGAIRARGWELSIEWNDKIGSVSYGVGFNLADAVTKVLNYPSNPTKAYGSLYNGKTVGEIWGYSFGGILQAEDLVLVGNKYVFYGPHPSSYTVYPGSPWYKDINGDGFISTGSGTVDDPGDYHIIGNNTPRFNIGVNLYAGWNGFDFNAFFQGVGKRDYWMSSQHYWGNVGYGGSQWMWERSWKPDNIDAKYPMYGQTPATCDYYLIDASYFRLKQVVLGYTLPSSIMKKIRIEKLRFNISAYNLFSITHIPRIFDPDQMTDAYPQKRTIAIGAQITF